MNASGTDPSAPTPSKWSAFRSSVAAWSRRVEDSPWGPRIRVGSQIGLALIVLHVSLWLVPEWLLRSDLGAAADAQLAKTPTLLDAYRQTVLKVLGGGVVGVGLYFTYRRLQQTDTTNRISEEGQVTERFTRAIEQLGSAHTAIQLGGVYALERIMRDSPKDHAAVMEVLAAFIRDNATEEANAPIYTEDELGERFLGGYQVPTVVQAAVTALGQREARPDEPPIRIPDVWLRGYDLAGAHFDGVVLSDAHLERAFLVRAHLEGASLYGAHLKRARLDLAHLERATLHRADLDGTSLDQAYLYGAHLEEAYLRGAYFNGAHLKGVLCDNSTFYGATIDHIRYQAGMPDPRTEAWPPFVAERRAERNSLI